MSSLNGVTYICSAGLSSVTSAGSLGPYFALTYFLPMYDFRIDKTICDTSALSISSLNYSSATHNSLSALEKIYNNPELSGQGSYNIANFNSLYLRDVTGGGPLFTNTRQRNADNKVNILDGKVLQNQVSAVGFSNTANGSLSATGSYTTLNGTSVNSWNPLSGTTANWNYKNLFRVTSYSPNQSTSGTASGNYKCRIPAGTGSFKFNMLAIYATRVNQFGYADPGVVGSPYNPTLFAIVVFDTPQVKSDTAGSLNAFEANVELNFALQSAQAQAIYVNTDYFTRVPTSNTTSAYALNYDGDVVISSSASPGSWVPRAKLTITDPEKDQVRLAYDDSRFTNIKTQSFKPYPTYPPTAAMAVLNIDTSCPDDSLLQLGYNCAATGIKSVAIGCYSSALGYEDSGSPNFGQINPDFDYIYKSNRGGYTLAIGVETLSQGLVSTSLGYQTSSIGFASFAGGFGSIASSQDMYTMYYGNPSEGMNFAYGFKTSAITDSNSIFPGNGSPSSISTWFTGIIGNLAGGNFAANIQTLAKGNGNVALGIDTVAYGTGNTSLGMATSAMNILSIATGLSTIANGILSQSHGQYTSANAILSYVYGGLALADVNAHGSFTFGSPYIYGSGGGNTTLYIPGYSVRVWDGSSEQTTTIAESSYVVDKYVSTYNDAMASFVYGQGSSAFTEALHSFVAGPMNQTKSQASFIFGYLNTINTNSGFNSVIGSNNTLTSSKYTHVKGSHNTLTGSDYSFITGIKNTATGSSNSLIVGFDNTITSSLQSHIFGSDNTHATSWYSTIVGRLNTVTGSSNSISIGNYNTLTNAANSVSLGVNNKITAPNSYAIGKNVKVDGTNSVAIGSGAFATDSNTIVIGSCEIETTKIESKNVLIDVKTNCSVNSQSKITLKADEIVLDGYTGNIEKYKFSIAYGRYVNTEATADQFIKIKIFRTRIDSISGKSESVYLLVKPTNGSYTFYIRSAKGVSLYQNNGIPQTVIGSKTNIKYIMVNPISSNLSDETAWKFGDNLSDISGYLSQGYRLLMRAQTNVMTDQEVFYYAFNDVKNINMFTHANRNSGGTGARDILVGYSDEYVTDYQNITSDSSLKLVGWTYDNRDDVTVGFVSRLSNGTSITKDTGGAGVIRCIITASLNTGLIESHNENESNAYFVNNSAAVAELYYSPCDNNNNYLLDR